MITWYSFDPTDSLFFKGSTPMQAGVDHTADSIFPPRPSTLEGALRTLVLRQQGINPADYYKGMVDKDILDAIGRADEPAPFCVIGPLFRLFGRLLIPAPYTWYTEEMPNNDRQTQSGITKIIRSTSLKSMKTGKLNIKSSAGDHLQWVRGENSGLASMGGMWVTTDLLGKDAADTVLVFQGHQDMDHKKPLAVSGVSLYVDEPHVGLALQEHVRTAKRHHLYAFTHYRLRAGVSLVFGVNRELPLKPGGILQLGGEMRFGAYARLDTANIPQGASVLYMSLGMVKTEPELTQALIATGKPIYAGGWDMRKGFHKDMAGYYPPGSVFTEEVKTRPNFIQI